MNQEIAFKINNLNFYYHNICALKNINLSIPRKEIMAFIGPSGCGKSTLIRCLNRLYDLYPGHKATGEILFNNVNILDSKLDMILLRTKIGMVLQKSTAFPMSIFDNIMLGLKLHRVCSKQDMSQRVEEALKQASLWDEVKNKLRKSALSLSIGQQQRLCIARSIALKPEVLLLDEPTSALDPLAVNKVEELLLELKKNYTIIIVTHNMQQAKRIADRISFLYLGELIESNLTEEIINCPKQKLTQEYFKGDFG